MASLTLVLFRDGRSASADAGAILRDVVHSHAGHYSFTEVDVELRPRLAERYHVTTTPTILLMKNGDVVDRIVGTPNGSLVHDLLDARGGQPAADAATES